MDWFYEALSRRAAELDRQNQILEKRKNELSSGSVYLRCITGKEYLYFDGRKGSQKICTSISREEEGELCREMAYREYLQEILKTNGYNLRQIQRCKEKYKPKPVMPETAGNFLARLKKPEDFSYLYTDGGDYRSDELIHRSLCGIFVRSKSELAIADLLYSYGIRFHYEKRLKLGLSYVLPDFTIYPGIRRQTIYWEHCGLLDNELYQESFRKKLVRYFCNGLWPGLNLICTYDEAGCLDMQKVERLIRVFQLQPQTEE